MNVQMNNNIPNVWERTGNGERGYDLFSRLLKDRIIFYEFDNDELNILSILLSEIP